MLWLKCKYTSRIRLHALGRYPGLMPRSSAYRRKIHAYARTPVWARRSRLFRESVGFRCAGCGAVSRQNHAHHLSYARAFSGREPDSDLMCLCSVCHTAAHSYARAHPALSLRTATHRSLKAKVRARSGKPSLLRRLLT